MRAVINFAARKVVPWAAGAPMRRCALPMRFAAPLTNVGFSQLRLCSSSAGHGQGQGLSPEDAALLRRSLQQDAVKREERAREDAARAARAKAEGREVWELEKEEAESHELLKAPAKQQMGGAGVGTQHGDMMAIFTCGRCETRSAKRFSKHAYTKGIVIVQCPSCEVRHLLADNMGWFQGDHKNIEEVLAARGETVQRLSNSVFIETLAGTAASDATPATDAPGGVLPHE